MVQARELLDTIVKENKGYDTTLPLHYHFRHTKRPISHYLEKAVLLKTDA